jgi:hypothetical protein
MGRERERENGKFKHKFVYLLATLNRELSYALLKYQNYNFSHFSGLPDLFLNTVRTEILHSTEHFLLRFCSSTATPLVRRYTELINGYKESLSYTASPSKHPVTGFPGVRRLNLSNNSMFCIIQNSVDFSRFRES